MKSFKNIYQQSHSTKKEFKNRNNKDYNTQVQSKEKPATFWNYAKSPSSQEKEFKIKV